MKEKYSTLHELANTSAIHKVKIKVIEKSRPFQSPGKKKYQRLLLQDEKGDVMRATLFEDDIQAYDSLIQQNHEYLISNPTIKPVDERYQSRSGEYQMTFSNRTVIQAVGSPSQASGPVYHSIATIPRTSGPYDRFDIIGVVLLIGDKRMVRGAFEQHNNVSEIIITDHSSHQPLTVSAWNDMAEFFKTKTAENQIVGFTSLRVTSHKGFGLSTMMSSLIIPTPNGEKADSLRQWASSHGSLLRERKTQILNTRMPLNQRQPTTIAFIKSKTAANTIQEERHWIKASIENCSYNDIRKFVGCDRCNKKTDNERNEVFECPWCHKKDSIAKPRLALSFDAHDSTSSIQLTAFNDTIAELFGKTIDELYSRVTNEHIVSYQDIAQSLRVKPIEIQLGPTVALSKCGVLKWVLKSIAIAPDTSPNPKQLPCKPSDTRSSQESVIAQLTDATSSCAPESSSASLKLETNTHSAQEIVPAPLTIAPSDDPQPSSASKKVKTVKRSLDFSDAATSSDVLDFNA